MQETSLRPLRREVPLRDRIHDLLRMAILSGELPPGTPVIEAELAARLGASRTPVREALRRLETAGLLEPRGLRGSVVRQLDANDVACIFEIREALETLVVRRAAPKITDDELATLEHHLAEMRAHVDDPNAMESHDTAFHDLILASAHGERLRRMLSEIREELISYRFLSLSDPMRRRAVLAEHAAILDALRAHDEEAAVRATATHVAAARDAVLARSIP